MESRLLLHNQAPCDCIQSILHDSFVHHAVMVFSWDHDMTLAMVFGQTTILYQNFMKMESDYKENIANKPLYE